jgi:hypothetical protein
MTSVDQPMLRSSHRVTGRLPSCDADLIMKIGIIGSRRVGCACALAAVVRGSGREIVIVDRTRKRANAVATDLRYGSPLSMETTKIWRMPG